MNIEKKSISKNAMITGETLPVEVIQQIKEELRSWYGCLSVREIVSNKILMAEIKKLEQLLSSQLVVL